MVSTLREGLASSCRIQRLFLVGSFIVLISPTLTMAAVIFEDDFNDGLLDPVWFQDWGMWASQGYDGTNDPAPPPVRTFTTPGSSPVGCDVNNPFDACGPLDPPTLASQRIPFSRPVDIPGQLTTGIAGWMTLRADPVNLADPPGCDPDLDECGPCDPATQDCYERADGTMRVEGIDISNTTLDGPIGAGGTSVGGVHLGMTARMHGAGGGNPVGPAILASYITAGEGVPRMWIFEIKYTDPGDYISEFELPGGIPLGGPNGEDPLHMELTVCCGDNAQVTFTVGDPNNEYTIQLDVPGIGLHVHNSSGIPVDHTREIFDPGRWGFLSFSAENSGTDWHRWDNFCFTDPGETCATTQPGDTEPDGDVDGKDFLGSQLLGASAVSDWKGNYGVATLSGVAAVPEPSVLSLCALAAFALWPTRRQRV